MSGAAVPLIAKYLTWTFLTSLAMLALNVIVSHIAMAHAMHGYKFDGTWIYT